MTRVEDEIKVQAEGGLWKEWFHHGFDDITAAVHNLQLIPKYHQIFRESDLSEEWETADIVVPLRGELGITRSRIILPIGIGMKLGKVDIYPGFVVGETVSLNKRKLAIQFGLDHQYQRAMRLIKTQIDEGVEDWTKDGIIEDEKIEWIKPSWWLADYPQSSVDLVGSYRRLEKEFVDKESYPSYFYAAELPVDLRHESFILDSKKDTDESGVSVDTLESVENGWRLTLALERQRDRVEQALNSIRIRF